jgi:hypothetical protein
MGGAEADGTAREAAAAAAAAAASTR